MQSRANFLAHIVVLLPGSPTPQRRSRPQQIRSSADHADSALLLTAIPPSFERGSWRSCSASHAETSSSVSGHAAASQSCVRRDATAVADNSLPSGTTERRPLCELSLTDASPGRRRAEQLATSARPSGGRSWRSRRRTEASQVARADQGASPSRHRTSPSVTSSDTSR